MRKQVLWLICLLVSQTQAQVLDVNNDGLVGPHEAISVAEQWKGQATLPNGHNHLGQTWLGNRNPLVIRGHFPERPPFIPAKGETKGIGGFEPIPQAPLILDNTGTGGPDLLLGGARGIIGIDPREEGILTLNSNQVALSLKGSKPRAFVVNVSDANSGRLNFSVEDNGDLFVRGMIDSSKQLTVMDHPVFPKTHYLKLTSVTSPQMKNVYDGSVTLDEEGKGTVFLPDYFEALNTQFCYQLTPIGSSAPDLFIAQEIEDNTFEIGGGQPGMKVSWQVTGIRQDAYAKANPIEVEQEKPEEDKGKFLHPELFGEPREKSVMMVSED